MATLENIHSVLDSVLPLPVDLPKIYLLGDTGAGKSTVLQHVLGTKERTFPSALKRRTTVAITEYVLDRSLPFKSCFLLKTYNEVKASIDEILEYSQGQLIKQIQAGKEIDIKDVVDNLGESPDQRFRLKYLVDDVHLSECAQKLKSHCIYWAEKSSGEEEIPLLDVSDELYELVAAMLREQADVSLGNEVIPLCQNYLDIEPCVNAAKIFLKSGRDSLSPLVSYARIQGAFGGEWLEDGTRFVIVDGEGIGHDVKESAVLSARHIDYFKFCDAIVLAEGAGKPFAAGGKSAIHGVIQNGYVDRFSLLITKLDELIDEDEEEQLSFDERIQDVRRSYKNLDQAFENEGLSEDRWKDYAYYVENLKNKIIPENSAAQLNALFQDILYRYSKERSKAKRPEYDFEMLSAYLEKASIDFHDKWEQLLRVTPWQSIKAFNRRMIWKEDEYKYLKPVAQLQDVILKELRIYILNPQSWPENISDEEKQDSLDQIIKRFSTNILSIIRERILQLVAEMWKRGIELEGPGSTPKRKYLIEKLLAESVPHYDSGEAIQFKDAVKDALLKAINVDEV